MKDFYGEENAAKVAGEIAAQIKATQENAALVDRAAWKGSCAREIITAHIKSGSSWRGGRYDLAGEAWKLASELFDLMQEDVSSGAGTVILQPKDAETVRHGLLVAQTMILETAPQHLRREVLESIRSALAVVGEKK